MLFKSKNTKDGVNLADMVVQNEKRLFSCECDTEEKRQLILTPTNLIITYGKKGGSFPIENVSIEFEKYDELYRITARNGTSGFGIRVDKDKFEKFWKKYNNIKN